MWEMRGYQPIGSSYPLKMKKKNFVNSGHKQREIEKNQIHEVTTLLLNSFIPKVDITRRCLLQHPVYFPLFLQHPVNFSRKMAACCHDQTLLQHPGCFVFATRAFCTPCTCFFFFQRCPWHRSRPLREAAAVQPAQVQLLPLRHRPLRPDRPAHRGGEDGVHLLHRKGPGGISTTDQLT